jgi:hypothetical protein
MKRPVKRKFNSYILIMANDIKDALKQLEEGLSYMLVPYVITIIQLSTIAEVFPYIPAQHIQPVTKIIQQEIDHSQSDDDDLETTEDIESTETEESKKNRL